MLASPRARTGPYELLAVVQARSRRAKELQIHSSVSQDNCVLPSPGDGRDTEGKPLPTYLCFTSRAVVSHFGDTSLFI